MVKSDINEPDIGGLPPYDIGLCDKEDCPQKHICYRFYIVPKGRDKNFYSRLPRLTYIEPDWKNDECLDYWQKR